MRIRTHNKYPAAIEGQKACASCAAIKPLVEYPKNARNKDGRDSSCRPCCAEKTRAWRSKSPEAARASEELWRKRNADAVRDRQTKYSRLWRQENREKVCTATAKWRSKNQVAVKDYSQKHMRENPEQYAAKAAKRRATLLQATPKWLTSEHHRDIAAKYLEARLLTERTGEAYHVDHISPLKGKWSCGLHVPWNLQVITAVENQRKWIKEAA